jgi:hypothetical protein
MGLDIYDVFKTSPGRINPRTGKLVQYQEYEAIAPWELEERMRSRGRGRDFDDRPRSRRDDDDRPRSRRDDDDDRLRDYPRPRRDYGEMFRSSMAGNAGMGNVGEFFGNAIPWVFLGVAAIVALEASGVTNFSSAKA